MRKEHVSPKRETLILRDDMLLVMWLRHPKHPCVMFGVKLSMFPTVSKRDATPLANPRCSQANEVGVAIGVNLQS